MWVETLKQARRIVVAVVGFTVIAIGVAMIVTPGPGWLVIFLGLSILGAEFLWARRLLRRLKRTGAGISRTLFARMPRRQDPRKGEGARAGARTNRDRQS